MAITFRNIKGAPLTHDELDENFRSYFHSASVEGSALLLYRPYAVTSSISFPIDPAVGRDGYVQVKGGNAISGADAVHTASAAFVYDYHTSELRLTGSLMVRALMTGSGGTGIIVSGSQRITENLIVDGTVTAEEFITEKVATSYIYKSGSTKFGDDTEDNHAFTGSVDVTGRLEVTGPTTQSGDILITGNTNQTGDYTLTGEITQSGNILHTGNTIRNGGTLLRGNFNHSGSISVNAVGDVKLTGDITQTGSIEVSGQENKIRFHYNNVASLPSAVTYHGMFAHTHDEGKAWFSHAGNWIELATSESVQSSYLKNTTDTLDGNLTVTGTITAQEYNTEFVSSSIIFESGSTQFGNSVDDTHIFTGSVSISGSITADVFTARNGTGTPTLIGDSGIILSSSNHVQIKGASLRMHLFSSESLGSHVSTDGDVIYNTTENTIQFYSGSAFTSLLTSASAAAAGFGAGGGGGLANVVEDTTPQLGGTLELNGNSISGSGTINISGSITAGGDITAFFSSDERLKENITPIDSALNKINQIGGYEFDWNNNSEHSGHDVGVIAQEIEKVLPEVVATRDNGYKAVRYEKIVALLIQAVKEQQSQIDELKSKL